MGAAACINLQCKCHYGHVYRSRRDRTGVQLKDKWRNLVKFRHIGVEEQKTFKVKSSGPWSKKYSSSQLTRDR